MSAAVTLYQEAIVYFATAYAHERAPTSEPLELTPATALGLLRDPLALDRGDLTLVRRFRQPQSSLMGLNS
jgi:hypothetical protein